MATSVPNPEGIINPPEGQLGGAVVAKAGGTSAGESGEQREAGDSGARVAYIERDSRGRERLLIPKSRPSSHGRKTDRELLNESEEREATLGVDISALQARLSYAQRNQWQLERLREEHQRLIHAHNGCRNTHAQLDAQVREVRRFEDLLADEEDKVEGLQKKIEELKERIRLMKRTSGESDIYRTRYEEKSLEVEVLRQRLSEKDQRIIEKDEQIKLAEMRIDSKNGTILYLKNYLRTHGFRVEDSPSEVEKKGDDGTEKQFITLNASLGNRIVELEAINESFRVKQLEQDEQKRRDSEVMPRESEETLKALRDIDEVIMAVSRGDLNQKMVIQPSDVDSDFATLKRSINGMVDQLQTISSQVSSVVRDVGQYGILGGYVQVANANGAWKEMVDNVNRMSQTLTYQVRSISTCIQAIGNGDFTQTIDVESSGEILILKELVNHVTDKLMSIVNGVTKLGTQVAIEDGIGEKVSLDGLQGSWLAMVGSTNSMASLITDQSRAVSEVTNRVLRQDTTALHIDPIYTGKLRTTFLALNAMLDYLYCNWTHRPGEVGEEARDQTSEQEKLQNIWAILNSNI